MFSFSVKFFQRFCLWTIIFIYLVIIAGSVVRSTGSGMGCPDWPTCFGRLIPPTSLHELPINYVDLYSKGGTLTVEFNVYKTWTEYINRLIGVLVGFFIFFTFIFSFSYYFINKKIVWWCFISFLLVGFQGWLGAKVVDSNLKPFMITIHMFIALLIVAILIYIYSVVKNDQANVKGVVSIFLLCLLVCFTVIQIIIGTQVRQEVDVVSNVFNHLNRSLWISKLGNVFVLHRLFAYFILVGNLFLVYTLHKLKDYSSRNLIFLVLLFELLSGFILTYCSLPFYIQPFHLVLATILFGIQFYLLVSQILLKITR